MVAMRLLIRIHALGLVLVLASGLSHCSCEDASGCKFDMDCPGTQMCVDGKCWERTCENMTCDDGEECTQDRCENAQCVYEPIEDGSYCGEPQCEGLELKRRECVAGVCTGVETEFNCDDGDPCTTDSCDEISGCANVQKAPGEDCGPCSACNEVGTCVEDLDQHLDCPLCKACGAGGRCVNQPAGSDIKAECPDAVFCNGLETCDGNGACGPGNDPCPGLTCDETARACIGCTADAQCPVCQVCNAGTCVNQPEGSDVKNECAESECGTGNCDGNGACSGLPVGSPCTDTSPDNCLAAGCDAQGNCDQAQGPEATGKMCRAASGDCDAAELCNGVTGDCPADGVQPSSYQCRASAADCDAPEYCDGSTKACPADGLEPASTVCRPPVDECDSAEYCDGESEICPADVPVPQGGPCAGGSGVCCNNQCQVGWECCDDGNCDDSNLCTTDACSAGTCTHVCPDPDCLMLDVTTPATVGQPTEVLVTSCNAGIDPASVVCYSSRNEDIIMANDFESGWGEFTHPGTVSLTSEAQSTLPGSTGGQGVKICVHGSEILSDLISTQGMFDIGLRFSMSGATLTGDRQMIVAQYLSVGDGTNNLVLAGDGVHQSWQEYFFILPPAANDDPSLRIRIEVYGGGAGVNDCGYVDDFRLLDMLPMSEVQILLHADFEGGFGVFSEYDPDGGDVNLDSHDGSTRVQLEDNLDAHIVSGSIDTTGVDPYNLLILQWDWDEHGALVEGRYVRAEYSADDGNSWSQLSSTGQVFAPTSYQTYRAILPCQATGVDNLRIRFISPASSSNDDSCGIRVDNITLKEYAPEWVDWFDPFTDLGDGVLQGTMTSLTQGDAQVHCSIGCGATEIRTNQVPVSFIP